MNCALNLYRIGRKYEKIFFYNGGSFGIFDNDGLREKIIEALRVKKNLEAGPTAFDFKAFKEEQYDLLAETVEANLDMKKIMEIIGEIEK